MGRDYFGGFCLKIVGLPDSIQVKRIEPVYTCLKCGIRYDSRTKFCPECGNKVVIAEPLENEEPLSMFDLFMDPGGNNDQYNLGLTKKEVDTIEQSGWNWNDDMNIMIIEIASTEDFTPVLVKTIQKRIDRAEKQFLPKIRAIMEKLGVKNKLRLQQGVYSYQTY